MVDSELKYAGYCGFFAYELNSQSKFAALKSKRSRPQKHPNEGIPSDLKQLVDASYGSAKQNFLVLKTMRNVAKMWLFLDLS